MCGDMPSFPHSLHNVMLRHRDINSCYTTTTTTVRPERLWGTPSLLSKGYQGLFPVSKAAGA